MSQTYWAAVTAGSGSIIRLSFIAYLSKVSVDHKDYINYKVCGSMHVVHAPSVCKCDSPNVQLLVQKQRLV